MPKNNSSTVVLAAMSKATAPWWVAKQKADAVTYRSAVNADGMAVAFQAALEAALAKTNPPTR